MQEGIRRPLRNNRKPPNYLASEVNLLRLRQEDYDTLGTSRQGPTKESRYSTPPIHVLAKLLIKFINQANINLRNAHKPQQTQALEKDKKNGFATQNKVQTLQKNKIQNQKRSNTHHKEIQDEGTKKPKDLYSFKGQHPNSDLKYLPLPQLSKSKHESAYNLAMTAQMMNLQYPYINQLNQHQMNKLQHLSQLEALYSIGTKSLPYSSTNTNGGVIGSHKQHLFGQLPLQNKSNNKNPLSSKSQIQKNELASDKKLFKRSSFHVAIAYHIHIKKLKASGRQLSANDIDPTYCAKKLKESKDLTLQQKKPNGK